MEKGEGRGFYLNNHKNNVMVINLLIVIIVKQIYIYM